MKTYVLVLALLVIFSLCGMGFENSSSMNHLNVHSELPMGMYIWNEQDLDVWNDSIQVMPNKLTVFRNPKSGYGRMFTFTYTYTRINTESLVLHAFSMVPAGVYVTPEQYPWHNDTLLIRFSDSGITSLIGPQNDEYTLNAPKP